MSTLTVAHRQAGNTGRLENLTLPACSACKLLKAVSNPGRMLLMCQLTLGYRNADQRKTLTEIS